MVGSMSYPDGVDIRHASRRGLFHRHANLLSLMVLGILMAAALLGLFGGGKDRPISVENETSTFTVAMPRVLRNGEFFEMRMNLTAKRDMGDATIAIAPSLWCDMTINTTVPSATEEDANTGRFRFHYGPLKAGERLVVKMDGQINPPLFAGTRGTVAVMDGGRVLHRVPITVKVLP